MFGEVVGVHSQQVEERLPETLHPDPAHRYLERTLARMHKRSEREHRRVGEPCSGQHTGEHQPREATVPIWAGMCVEQSCQHPDRKAKVGGPSAGRVRGADRYRPSERSLRRREHDRCAVVVGHGAQTSPPQLQLWVAFDPPRKLGEPRKIELFKRAHRQHRNRLIEG